MLYQNKKCNKRTGIAFLFISLLLLVGLFTVHALAEAQTYHRIEAKVQEGNEAYGSVQVSGDVKDEDGNFLFGSYVTLTATPNPGYDFVGWYEPDSDERLSSDVSFRFVVAGDVSYSARFAPKVYSIVYEDCPSGVIFHGQVTSHTFGTTTVVPNPTRTGYTFTGWIVNALNDPQKDLILTGETAYSSGVITLRAVWEPNAYRVIRFDFKEGLIDTLGSEVWKTKLLTLSVQDLYSNPYYLGLCDGDENGDWLIPMGSVVKGNEGAAAFYAGYHFEDLEAYYTECTVSITNEENPNVNKVFRVYRPNVYAITYVCEGYSGTWEKNTHTYDSETVIHQYPSRVGYTFVGWNVNGANVYLDTAHGEPLVLGATDYLGDITLTALWEPLRYGVHYNLVGGVMDEKPIEHIYGTDTVFEKNPTRVGYTFLGWKVNGTLVELDASAGETLVLGAEAFTDDISLEAVWTPNIYRVTLDEQGATVSGVLHFDATYDMLPDALTLLPTRVGHTFLGYYSGKDGSGVKYFHADGTAAHVWDCPSDTTLYALWQVNAYRVTVNVNDATVLFNYGGHDYSYPENSAEIDFGTEVRITVTANALKKVVAWNGVGVPHSACFTYTLTVGAEELTLTGVVCPDISLPTFTVNYLSDPEVFLVEGELPEGRYRFYADGLPTLELTVNDKGAMELNGMPVARLVIPEEYFGKTVSLMRFGDGETTADSDPVELVIKSRPAAPVENTHIKGIYADNTTIRVEMFENLMYEYQFAISKDPRGTDLTWGASPLFTDLEPGTIYYVFCRVKAADTEDTQYPYGVAFLHEINTNYSDYVRDMIASLEALRQDGDGDNVDTLLKNAIAAVNDVPKPSATFYEDLQAIYQRTEAAVPFARRQDEKVAALARLCKQLIDSGAFSPTAIAELNGYLETARTGINAATTDDVVQMIYSSAEIDMRAVKVSYLTYGDLRMESLAGLPQTVQLTLLRFPDFGSISTLVDAAIKAENLAVKNAEMAYRLRSLDVMAAYSLKLSDAGSSFTSFDGGYVFRLLIPEELRGTSGLLVAYYNDRTGVLEVLDTTVDGNCLVFTANRVADFVILGDPIVHLTWLIILLSFVLFFQMLAVILILSKRAKYKGLHRSYAVMPAVFLTVRFLPQGAVTAVIVLGALAILMQAFLTYLLLSSELFFRKKRVIRYEEPEEDAWGSTAAAPLGVSSATVEDGEEWSEQAPILDSLTEDEFPEEERLIEIADEYEDHGDAAAFYGASFAPDDEAVPSSDEDAAEEELYEEDYYAPEFEQTEETEFSMEDAERSSFTEESEELFPEESQFELAEEDEAEPLVGIAMEEVMEPEEVQLGALTDEDELYAALPEQEEPTEDGESSSDDSSNGIDEPPYYLL